MNLGFLEFLGEPLMTTVKELPPEYGELHTLTIDLWNLANKLKNEGYEAGDLFTLGDRLEAWLQPHYDITTDDDGER